MRRGSRYWHWASLAVVAGTSAASLAASPAWAAVQVTVPIVYTAKAEGLFRGTFQINELADLYDGDEADGVRSDGFVYDPGLLRHGRWSLYGPNGSLSAKEARGLFGGKGLVLAEPTPVNALVTDYAVIFQEPDKDPPWLVGWLATRADAHNLPDVKIVRGAVFEGLGDNGKTVRVFSEDGTPPPPEALTDHLAWIWASGGFGPATRAGVTSRYRALGRTLGGLALHGLADKVRKGEDALRVDAGDLVDDPISAVAAFSIDETLDAVPAMALDALVPYEHELRLTPERMAKLAKAAPLVACNLKAPAELGVRPYVMREKNGMRIALVGVADAAYLIRFGLVHMPDAVPHQPTDWFGEDGVVALGRTLDALKATEHPDAIVVITNVDEGRLPALRRRCRGVATIITRHPTRADWRFTEHYDPENPDRTRDPLPGLVVGVARTQVGRLRLRFDGEPTVAGPAPSPRLARQDNQVWPALDISVPDPDPARSWRYFERLNAAIQSNHEVLLPDLRKVAAGHAQVQAGEGGQTLYDRSRWTRLSASVLRVASNAEVAILNVLRGGSSYTGEVWAFSAEKWLPHERLVMTSLTGVQIKRLLHEDPDGTQFGMAGIERTKLLIGGRPILDAERYRVVTVESVARGDDHRTYFDAPIQVNGWMSGRMLLFGGDRKPEATVRDVVMAGLTDLKARHVGFTPPYIDELAERLLDDGTTVEPRWTVKLAPLETSFSRFSVANREAFGAVRNAQVNNPDSALAGGKINMAVTYETGWYDWENRVALAYQQTNVPSTGKPATEQQDNIGLTTEARIKALRLQSADSTVNLVPFVNTGYITEFTPTTNAAGRPNPFRRELNGIAGLVVNPKSFVKEIRVGAIAKNDLAVQTGGFEPGLQLATSLEQKIGVATLVFDVDWKQYMLTPEDTAEDLAYLGKVSTAVKVPLWGALGLSVGIDAYLFSGKIPATRVNGTSIAPSVGITYNGSWKPFTGQVF